MLNLPSDFQGIEGGEGEGGVEGEVEGVVGSVTYAGVLPGPLSVEVCKADPFAAERPVIWLT